MSEDRASIAESDSKDAVAEEPRERLPLRAKVSGVLFVSAKPIPLETIARAVGAPIGAVEHEIDALQNYYSGVEHGFTLEEVAGGYCFRSAPEAAEAIRRLMPPKTKRLSRAAAETLAVIAYKQPVQRAEIEAIRGVDALPTLKTLLDAKLVRAVGREDAVGHPTLYGTTQAFLERFGLRDLSELPSLRDLEAIEEEPGEVDTDEDDSTVNAEGAEERV